MAIIVATFLSQEGFDEPKTGYYYSREISTIINNTATKDLYNLTVDEFVYKDIHAEDLPTALDAIHKFDQTGRTVVLYNLQRIVKIGRILPIKEAV